MPDSQYRLITRSDFDGLVCAVLLKELNLIDDVLFIRPDEWHDESFEVTENDILANLPYVEGCYLAFGHHLSDANLAPDSDNIIVDASAPSSARVMYDYYGGRKQFQWISEELLTAVDKSDSAQFTRDEILSPSRWTLLSFLIDPRTGLDQVNRFQISNNALLHKLIDACRKRSIEEVLRLKDIQERIDFFFSQSEAAKEQILRCTSSYEQGRLIVLDLRNEPVIHPTNRFMVYAIFPKANLSIHLLSEPESKTTVFFLGKSILNRSSKLNIGELCRQYGGGGHLASGEFHIAENQTDHIRHEIIEKIAVAA